MNKQAYETSVGLVLGKRAADADRSTDDYYDEMMAKIKKERDTERKYKDEVHAVNSMLALSGLAGAGMMASQSMSELGGTLLGGAVGGGGLYHLARLFKAPKALRLIAGLAGAIGGGAIGNDLVTKYEGYKPIHYVQITNDHHNPIRVGTPFGDPIHVVDPNK